MRLSEYNAHKALYQFAHEHGAVKGVKAHRIVKRNTWFNRLIAWLNNP